MGSDLILPAILLAIGIGLFFLEAIIPSMGLITVAGVVSVTSAVFLAFRVSTAWGGVFFVLAVASIPAAVLFFFYVVRRTSIVHKDTEGDYEKAGRDAEGLVGQEGVALSDLRPTGVARVAGRRIDVVAEGSFIEDGSRIKVIRADGFKILVREVTK